ncbi:MAG: DUF975 family protein [Bacteroidales bacterium]|nr:DUF975 family protein [Bacteroidales bacterium]
MKTNQEYKNAALEALRGRWAAALLCTIVLMLLLYIVMTPQVVSNMSALGQIALDFVNPLYVSGAGGIIVLFVLYPLLVGYQNTFKRLYINGDTDCVHNLFKESFNSYLRNVWGLLLVCIFCFLWCLLFIIPGIVKAYAYAMTPYILKDNPELSANEAVNLSIKMMKGRKFDLFYLHLSFIGWWILCVLTLGIGFLWLAPYVQTAQAAFYDDVRQDYLRNNN